MMLNKLYVIYMLLLLNMPKEGDKKIIILH